MIERQFQYVWEGPQKTCMRELALSSTLGVRGKEHVCFCIERKGNVVRIKMFTQVADWAVALLL